jgi:hypothetical protein
VHCNHLLVSAAVNSRLQAQVASQTCTLFEWTRPGACCNRRQGTARHWSAQKKQPRPAAPARPYLIARGSGIQGPMACARRHSDLHCFLVARCLSPALMQRSEEWTAFQVDSCFDSHDFVFGGPCIEEMFRRALYLASARTLLRPETPLPRPPRLRDQAIDPASERESRTRVCPLFQPPECTGSRTRSSGWRENLNFHSRPASPFRTSIETLNVIPAS